MSTDSGPAESYDPYWKLRPQQPTPADELCACPERPPLLLQPHFGEHPVCCLDCGMMIAPEALGLPAEDAEELSEEIHFWHTFHDCFYHLWLESGEFEAWGKAQLEDPMSPVNQRGLALCKRLEPARRTYYSWFEDVGEDGFVPTTVCPLCQTKLTRTGGRRVCEDCSIVLSSPSGE